jgi:hypothetical protein
MRHTRRSGKGLTYLIYDAEAIAVLEAHIKYGFGEWVYQNGYFVNPKIIEGAD